MAPACQEKNAKGLTMVAVGMNKSADELMILDDATREALASGKYHDQRRGSFGVRTAASGGGAGEAAGQGAGRAAGEAAPRAAGRAAARAPRPAGVRRPGPSAPARPRWTQRQERLALLYNERGLRPPEIAEKLGVSTYLATQIVLAARNRATAGRR
jgi:hypothetical protein